MVEYIWLNSRLLHIRYSGVVTGEELIQSALDNAGDARFDYVHYVLGDWSTYIRTEIDQEDVRTLIAMMKNITQICPGVLNATVIRPDKTGNAMVAFYKMLADELPWTIEIFHSFEDAFAWFDIPCPQHFLEEK